MKKRFVAPQTSRVSLVAINSVTLTITSISVTCYENVFFLSFLFLFSESFSPYMQEPDTTSIGSLTVRPVDVPPHWFRLLPSNGAQAARYRQLGLGSRGLISFVCHCKTGEHLLVWVAVPLRACFNGLWTVRPLQCFLCCGFDR